MARVTESAFLEKAPAVDAERGIIRGVKLCGFESRNGRSYPQPVLSAATRLYEGAKVYVDHPQRTKLSEDRSFRDWAGNVRGVRMESNGLYGDLHLRTKSNDYEALIEAAEKNWADFGLSHVAECNVVKKNGKAVVESISEVYSVDVVTDPATNLCLTESRERPMKKTIKQLLESAETQGVSVRQVLVEMMEASPEMASVEMETPEGASPDDAIKAGFKAMITAIVDDDSLDSSAMLAKIKEILKAKDKVEGSDAPSSDPPASDPPADAPTAESKLAAKLAKLEAKTLLLESGREATDVRIKALAAAADADRKALLESWPAKDAAPAPKSSGRPASSPPANGSENKTFESKWDSRVKAARERLAESKKPAAKR